MRFERDMLLLYAVTDRAWTGKRTLDEQVEEALQGGVTLVQLREKHLSKEQLIQEARRMTALEPQNMTAFQVSFPFWMKS